MKLFCWDRMPLHATQLTILCKGERITIRAPMPNDMAMTVDFLKSQP